MALLGRGLEDFQAAAPPKYNPADRVGNMHGYILTPSVFGRDQQIHGVDKKEKADARTFHQRKIELYGGVGVNV